MAKKIFITGGLGYIGAFFTKEAVKRGHTVRLYDSLIYEQRQDIIMKEILSFCHRGGKADLIIGDTRNLELLEQSLKDFQPDYVLHFGELSSVYACEHNLPYTEDVNYIASKAVIDLCERLNLPTLYNSSSSIYGHQSEMKLMTEQDLLPAPTDNYCKYKIMMENYITKKVANNPNYKIIIFRPATVCGLSPRMRIDLLPNHFTYCAASRGLIKISDSNAFRAIIDIQELVNGYFRVIDTGSWQQLIYNIGHYNLSKIQIATAIQSLVPCKILTASNVSIIDLRNLQIDCSCFQKEFNHQPVKPIEDTIRDLLLWLKNNLSEIKKNNFVGILNTSLNNWLKIV